MRKVFLFAAAAAMLAACSSKDIDTSQPDVSTQAPLEEGAVGFDAPFGAVGSNGSYSS